MANRSLTEVSPGVNVRRVSMSMARLGLRHISWAFDKGRTAGLEISNGYSKTKK